MGGGGGGGGYYGGGGGGGSSWTTANNGFGAGGGGGSGFFDPSVVAPLLVTGPFTLELDYNGTAARTSSAGFVVIISR
jgi:hypothetical protein